MPRSPWRSQIFPTKIVHARCFSYLSSPGPSHCLWLEHPKKAWTVWRNCKTPKIAVFKESVKFIKRRWKNNNTEHKIESPCFYFGSVKERSVQFTCPRMYRHTEGLRGRARVREGRRGMHGVIIGNMPPLWFFNPLSWILKWLQNAINAFGKQWCSCPAEEWWGRRVFSWKSIALWA